MLDPRHDHHAAADIDSNAPAGSGIFLHAGIQALCWGVLFPLGMILGIKKSRWHVPVQTTTMALTSAGYFLGHHHGGREYAYSFHATMGTIIIFLLLGQASTGLYLKLHLKRLRSLIIRIHGFLGRLYPAVGFAQALFGAQTFFGYCLGEEALQCYAHHTFGSAFIAYAALLVIMMYAGTGWLSRRGRSQEFYDSLMIMTFGIINTFSMRHSDGWSHKDLQHTALGLLWWASGTLGVVMSSGGRRNFAPAMTFIMTGYAFAGHVQHLMISTMVHTVLGYALAGAGVVRMVEVFFVLQDRPSGEGPRGEGVMGWQHLYPYLLTLTGCIFLAATDEELKAVDDSGLDAVTYLLIMFSLSFVIYLLIVALTMAYMSPSFGAAPMGSDPVWAKEEGDGYEAVEEDAEVFELQGGSDDGADVDRAEVDSFEGEMEGRSGGNDRRGERL